MRLSPGFRLALAAAFALFTTTQTPVQATLRRQYQTKRLKRRGYKRRQLSIVAPKAPRAPPDHSTAVEPWHPVLRDPLLGFWAVIARMLNARMASTWYWVGGTGTWDTSTTTNWASTSGGSGGAGNPASGDSVIFDGNSGGGTVTTSSGMHNYGNITLNTGFTGTLTCGSSLGCSGAFTLTQGTFISNGHTLPWGSFNFGNNLTRTLTLGASSVTINGTGTVWTATATTNYTISSNTATVTFSGVTQTITMGNISQQGMSVVINTTGTTAWNSAATVANFTYAPTAGTGNLLLMGQGPTVNTAVTFTGSAAPNTPLVASGTLGTQITWTCNGTVSNTGRMDFRDQNGAGTAAWSLSTSGGDCQGNSGITFATAQTNYYQASANDNFSTAANWYLATNGGGGAGRVPYPQDTAIFDANSGAHTYTFDTPRFGTLTMTGWTGTMYASSAMAWQCYGNLTFGATQGSVGGTYSTLSLLGRGSQTITGGTVSALPQINMNMNSIGGTYTQQNNFAMNQLQVLNGTWTANNFNFLFATFSMSAGTTNMGSGTWSVANYVAGQTPWQITGGTINCGTSTISWNSTTGTAGTWTFAGGGHTYYNFQWTTANTANQTLTITGANTFNSFTATTSSTGARTITWPSSTTNTFTSALTLEGTAKNYLTVNASTSGTYSSLSCNGTVTVQYLSLKDNRALGTGTFTLAGLTSRLLGNTPGWVLTGPMKPNGTKWLSWNEGLSWG